mmetsp:Transcript_60911/g.170332  ORF Transcript_60911/g.170332 Transcript_60911/m.170332 type:complete len:625 (+) Transcript_60911:78-1952(+)
MFPIATPFAGVANAGSSRSAEKATDSLALAWLPVGSAWRGRGADDASLASLSSVVGLAMTAACSRLMARRQAVHVVAVRKARLRDSEGRRLTNAPTFDASDAASVTRALVVEYKQRPFGITAYAPSINGKGALVWELGKERYAGDYQGRARQLGVKQGFAVRSIGGVNVASWDFYDIMDLLGDKILDNSSGKFQSISMGHMGNTPAPLPVEVEYVEVSVSDSATLPTIETSPPDLEQCWSFPVGDHALRFGHGSRVDDDFVHQLIDVQRNHAGETVLSLEDAIRLVERVTVLFKSEETLNRLHFETVVVVGDIHGQFFDLLRVFELEGMPSASNPYLFNGDFVDRGLHSLEVIFTLFALKIRFPDAVRMNRGNHESADLNLRYGFAAEIRDRYGPAGKRLFDAFSEAFRWLPLAHVLNSQVLVVHGGLPGPDPRLPFKDAGGGGTGYDAVGGDEQGRTGGRRGGGQQLSLLGYNPDNVSLPPRAKELKLSDIAALPRGSDPATELQALESLPEDEAEEKRLIVDLLWADPRGKTGYGPSYRVRKGCYIFGPDVTSAFMKTNGLRFMIRSHEVKVGGYEWTHPDCLSVFSAPNYLGHARNKAAVVRLTADEASGLLEPSVRVYEA